MHLPPIVTLLLLAALTGGSFGLPVKGGSEKTSVEKKSYEWKQPKDIDWSVTPGRLIPVSEATDDLPTPGYRMMDLQQRVPVGTPLQSPTESQTPEPAADNGQQQQTEKAEFDKTLLGGQTKVEQEGVSEKKSEESPKTEIKDASREKTEIEAKIEEKLLESSSTTEGPNSSTSTASKVNKETPQPSTEAPTPKPTTETSKVLVEEELMTKVILPEICSISGIGCRDKPVKETTESVSPDAFFQENDKVSNPEEKKNENQSNETEDKNFPGKFFLENSSRLSPVENSISFSRTESVSTESIDSAQKEVNNQQTEDSFTKTTVSEKSSQSSSTESSSNESNSEQKILKDHEHSSDSSSTEKEQFKSHAQVEEEIAQVKETEYQQALPPNLQQETYVQDTDLGQISFLGVLSDVSDGNGELEGQQVLQEDLSQSKEDSSSEEIQKRRTAIRRLDESEETQETTTVTKEVNDNLNKTDTNEQITPKSEHKTETSEEEKKLMEVSPFDSKNVTSVSQSDEPEKSLSIGERISSYWKSATDYVSKVLNI